MVKTDKSWFLGGGKDSMADDERIALCRQMYRELLQQSQEVWGVYLETRLPAAKELSSRLWGEQADWFQRMLEIADMRVARGEDN